MNSEDKTFAAIVGVWVLVALLNVAFWGALIWLGFYAVNKFAS